MRNCNDGFLDVQGSPSLEKHQIPLKRRLEIVCYIKTDFAARHGVYFLLADKRLHTLSRFWSIYIYIYDCVSSHGVIAVDMRAILAALWLKVPRSLCTTTAFEVVQEATYT